MFNIIWEFIINLLEGHADEKLDCVMLDIL